MQNKALGNLERCHGASGSEQSTGFDQIDGKQHSLPLVTKSRGSKNLGVKKSKACKRQHPSASPRPSSSKIYQSGENGGKSLGSKQHTTVWMGDLAREQTSSGTRRGYPPNQNSTN